jgi:hypothetical protein
MVKPSVLHDVTIDEARLVVQSLPPSPSVRPGSFPAIYRPQASFVAVLDGRRYLSGALPSEDSALADACRLLASRLRFDADHGDRQARLRALRLLAELARVAPLLKPAEAS